MTRELAKREPFREVSRLRRKIDRKRETEDRRTSCSGPSSNFPF